MDISFSWTLGIPKVYEKDFLFSSIISIVNSRTYFLSKHLYNEMKALFFVPKSHTNNSFDLIKKLEKLTIPEDYICMSLDVSSLFTNVPLRLVLKA